ncbi:enolase [Tanacetum coccineum]|uniref:phosphopyruvate hydratase n=1 Tax=Tanacetum coccineum TaxID=301880 RepID=A0ABQ5BDE4_9ASTR
MSGDGTSEAIPTSVTEAERSLSNLSSEDVAIENECKDGPFSNALISEMEADMHGIQVVPFNKRTHIFKPLEERKELGAGTYGMVYHEDGEVQMLPLIGSSLKHIANLAGNKTLVLRVPTFNVMSCGSHAGNKLAMQEFMNLAIGASSFKEAMKTGVDSNDNLDFNYVSMEAVSANQAKEPVVLQPVAAHVQLDVVNDYLILCAYEFGVKYSICSRVVIMEMKDV